jgi:uncharacterized protein (DUF2147 family)
MQKVFILIFSLFLATSVNAQADKIIGTWLTQDKEAQVEIYKSNNLYFGKITWFKQPNDPKTNKPWLDEKNQDPKKRTQPLLGSTMLWNFQFDDDEYIGGNVYDSRDGKTYTGKLWLTDNNTLKMRGYVGVFYSTETWTRVK